MSDLKNKIYEILEKTGCADLCNLYRVRRHIAVGHTPRIDVSGSDNSPIDCCDPAVVLTPVFQMFFEEGYTVVYKPLANGKVLKHNLKGRQMSYIRRVCSPRDLNMDLDSVLSCYQLNPETGDLKPLYMLAPCGKCPLCLAKKQNVYALRVAAEMAERPTLPVALLLTYNDDHLPRRGVCVRDFQNFMKRLRQALDTAGIVHRLRYLACGEYGSDHKRPHYHVLLMGFPWHAFEYRIEAEDFIQRAWSTYKLSLKRHGLMTRYYEDQDGNPQGSKDFLRLAKCRIPVLRWAVEPLGMVFFKDCDSGIARYFAKYITKSNHDVFDGNEDCDYLKRVGNPPIDLLNPPFICQSIGSGGLGTKYFQTHPADPTVFTYKVLDEVGLKSVTAGSSLPFNVAYPSVGRALGRDVYRDFRALMYIYTAVSMKIGADYGKYRDYLIDYRIPVPLKDDIRRYVKFGLDDRRFEALLSFASFLEDKYYNYPFALMGDFITNNNEQRAARNNFIEKNLQVYDVKKHVERQMLKDRASDRYHVSRGFVLPK